MEPWKSWAIVGVVGAGAAYYYSQSGKSKRGGGRVSSIQAEQSQRRASDSRNDSKDKRKKKGKASDGSDQATSDVAEASSASAQASSADKSKKRKGKGKQQPSKLAQSSAVEASIDQRAVLKDDEGEDDGIDNKEFAKQLSGLKTGTSLKKAETNIDNKKTRKQGKSKELPSEATNGTAPKPNGALGSQDFSTASSTTGADADDDLSLPVSPEFGATQNTTPSGADVSDMLEVPAKGPSVLRLTETVQPQPARQPKPQKAAPEPESKKQRQNRQKNEEKKAMREQAEKERRVLLEKQLRTAREAEGRPAKNGLAVPKAPTTNAWDKSTDSGGDAMSAPSTSNNAALLDTFDEDKSFLGETSSQLNVGANSTPASVPKVWDSEMLSEEEQMRLISEMDSDDTWSTVPKSGKAKKRNGAVTATEANKSTSSRTLNNPEGNGYRVPPSQLHNTSNNNNPSSTISKNLSHSHKTGTSSNSQTATNSDDAMSSGHAESLATAAGTASPGSEHQPDSPSGVGEEEVSTNLANTPVSSSTGTINTIPKVKRWQDLTKKELQSLTKAEYDALYLDRLKGTSDHHLARAKRWRAIGNWIKFNGGWDIKSIKQHPDYDSDWPYALIPHPMEIWTEDDWHSEDMTALLSNEKAPEEKLECSAHGETGSQQK